MCVFSFTLFSSLFFHFVFSVIHWCYIVTYWCVVVVCGCFVGLFLLLVLLYSVGRFAPQSPKHEDWSN